MNIMTHALAAAAVLVVTGCTQAQRVSIPVELKRG